MFLSLINFQKTNKNTKLEEMRHNILKIQPKSTGRKLVGGNH